MNGVGVSQEGLSIKKGNQGAAFLQKRRFLIWKEKGERKRKSRKVEKREKVGGDFEGVLEFRRQGKKKKGQQWLERQRRKRKRERVDYKTNKI